MRGNKIPFVVEETSRIDSASGAVPVSLIPTACAKDFGEMIKRMRISVEGIKIERAESDAIVQVLFERKSKMIQLQSSDGGVAATIP
jgi:hypothetical protein